MDEFQRLQFLDSRREDLAREADASRRAHQARGGRSAVQGFVALTVLLLGMLAWWGR